MARIPFLACLMIAALAGGSAPAAEDPAPAAPPAADAAAAERDRSHEFHLRQARALAGEARRTQSLEMMRRSVDAYTTAARFRPTDPVPTAEAGLLALDLGDGAVAARMLQEVHDAAPDSAAFHFLRGSLLLRRGEFGDAVVELRKCQGGDFQPESAKDRLFHALWSQGLVLINGADLHAAVKVLTETVELSPRHPLVSRAWWDLAVAHRKLLQPAEAEKILRDLTERFPTYAPSYGELGSLLAEQDRHDEAQEWLDKSVRVDPGYAQGYLLRAETFIARGRFAEAEASLRDFDSRFRPAPESEYQWGVLLHRRGNQSGNRADHRGAIERFRKALALDPGRIRALYFIVQCWTALDEPEEARSALERWKKAYDAFVMARRMHEEKSRESAQPAEGEAAPGDAPPAGDGGG